MACKLAAVADVYPASHDVTCQRAGLLLNAEPSSLRARYRSVTSIYAKDMLDVSASSRMSLEEGLYIVQAMGMP